MKKIFSKSLYIFINILPYIFVFIATIYHPVDLDLGWHLRFGKDLVEQKQMIYENTYSTEMTGFRWFNSSWALDGMRYLLWDMTGFWGHAILGALVPTLTLFILTKSTKLSLIGKLILFPIFIWFESPLYSHSFRGQELSLLFLAILFYVLEKYRKNNKTKTTYLLIPFFFLWANIHAQFVLGIVLFAMWLFIFLLQNISKEFKKHAFILSIIFGLSFIVTLINPYGIGIYTESLLISSNPTIQFIQEFLPAPTGSVVWYQLLVWGVMCLLSLGIMWRKRKVSLYLPIIMIGLLVYTLAHMSGRYIWTVYVLTFPLVAYSVSLIQFKNKVFSILIPSSLFILAIGFVVIRLWPERMIMKMSWESYCSYAECSTKAAKILIKVKNPGRIFTDYNYGGWLIWNYPEIKPSVDGRMSMWTDETGYNAFIRYIMLENNRNYIELSPFDTYFVRNARPVNYQLKQLVKQKKWKLLYRDQFASIYTRNK